MSPAQVELRSRGLGGSEIAAILGMDPRKDAFSVYCDKLGLLERQEANARMKWGKRVERIIADAYSEETNQPVQWADVTIPHPTRSWQIYTPDAFVLKDENAIGGLDAKNIAFDQAPKWADGAIPEWISLQCHWYMSASNLPWWDLACLFGGNDLRIARVNRDPEIEDVLLTEGEIFWRDYVQARNPPPIGSSAAAAEFLKKRFPRNIETLRPPTDEELPILQKYAEIRAAYDFAEEQKKTLENRIKLAIGDADGIAGWCTWKKNRDSEGVNYEKIGLTYLMTLSPEERAEVEKANWDVLKKGPRVFLWKAK